MGGGGGGGGSSGGSFLGKSPQSVAQSIRELEDKAKSEQFESDVAALLGDVLASANDRNTDAVATHLDEIRRALGKDIEGSVDLLFGGSVSKKTYVDGVSDVDALVVLNNSELAGKSPKEVCDYFLARLRERFPSTEVTPDGFALDVQFGDVTVQIVPVIRKGQDLLLPNDTCTAWSRVQPKAFTDALTAVNKTCANKVVPTIKLAKALMASLPEARRISGYHAELLATEIFTSYDGALTPKAMVQHFFAKAPQLVREPMRDPTGQSRFVDDHLGAAHSVERLTIADSLDRIGRRLRNADGAQSVDQWRELFEGGT
jgi:hypothetical protein